MILGGLARVFIRDKNGLNRKVEKSKYGRVKIEEAMRQLKN